MNKAGGPSFDADSPEFGLYKVVINNLLEDSYYTDVEQSIEDIHDAFTAAVASYPVYPLQLAIHARHEHGLRDIAQLLLVMAANTEQSKAFVPMYAPAIIDRMDELNTVISYQIRGYGKPIPKPLRRGVERALHKKYAVIRVSWDDVSETERQTYVEGIEDVEDAEITAINNVLDRHGMSYSDVAATLDSGPFSDDGVCDESTLSTEICDTGYVFNEYTASKYQQRNKDVSLHDVLNLVRPEPQAENRDALFERIVLGELDETDVEPLRETRTWEAERSSATTAVQFDGLDGIAEDTVLTTGVVTLNIDVDDAGAREFTAELIDACGAESTICDIQHHSNGINTHAVTVETDLTEADEFRHRLSDMGLFARVRNCRNMLEAGLSGDEIFDYDDDCVFGPESNRVVTESQMFPFRFYQAFRACDGGGVQQHGQSFIVDTGSVLDATTSQWLSRAVDASTENVPETLEQTFTAVDLSGSMNAPVSGDSSLARAEVGCLFGALLAKRDSDIGAFGTDFAPVELTDRTRCNDSVLQIAQHVYDDIGPEVGGMTNGHKVLQYLIEQEMEYERVVLLTDMQLWNSTRRRPRSNSEQLKQLWDTYTETIAPDAHLYCIDLAHYGDCVMPEDYHNVHQISGWSANILPFIDSTEQASDIISDIRNIRPGEW
jgi:hypothetical protein